MSEQYINRDEASIPYSPDTQQNIKKAATIAGYTGIIMIINLVLEVAAYFIKPAAIAIRPKEGFNDNMVQAAQQTGAGFSVFIGVMISTLLIYGLLRFSKFTKTALQTQSAAGLREGIRGLGFYFKVTGILLIACIVLMAIMLFAVGVGAAFK